MKHLLVTLGVVAFLAVLPLSHLALAQPPCPGEKVPLCHVNSANDSATFNNTLRTFGRVIEVDENAVPAHLAEHGDSLNFQTLTQEQREQMEEDFDISLPNANCYFDVTLNDA